MILASIIICIVMFLTINLIRDHIKASRLSSLDWQELVGRLQPVSTDGIAAVAFDHLRPVGSQEQRSPEVIWDLVGGVEGLTRMRENADVLVALASYAEQWNSGEGKIVAERMRRDGLTLRRAVIGIGLGTTCGYSTKRVSIYVQEAASSYYLMRQRLLNLYETTHSGLFPILGAAI